jgi:CHAT domain-containing protein
MESFLYLYDSIVDGLEIASWELKAELVVLSACSSGQRAISGRGMPHLPGDDLFGLQAAFFAAGAKRVIGSLWPVHSPAAKAIMTALHRQLATGQSPETALRSAILEYLRTARVGNRQSFYWAPFFLSAVGRPVVPSSVLM